ncbi:MAG: hypothetical protein JSU94_16735 [Phycisphaerales bacterium]|nr:MAG: hypothetical protein JSU94_16735 [Phycisphaerales bacterium]
MNKRAQQARKPTSFRLKRIVAEVLDELSKADIPGFPAYGAKNLKKPIPKSMVLEACVRSEVVLQLSFRISEHQIESFLDNPDGLFRLFLLYCKAERGEKGYGFTTKSTETRFVYGPPDDQIMDKVVSKKLRRMFSKRKD